MKRGSSFCFECWFSRVSRLPMPSALLRASHIPAMPSHVLALDHLLQVPQPLNDLQVDDLKNAAA